MKKDIKFPKLPKGYSFQIVEYYSFDTNLQKDIKVFLKKGKTAIGYVALCEFKKNKYETHSHLDSKYHGKGLGILLYSEAIKICLKKKKSVSSSSYPSEFAKRLWKSQRLNSFFKIRHTSKETAFVLGVKQ